MTENAFSEQIYEQSIAEFIVKIVNNMAHADSMKDCQQVRSLPHLLYRYVYKTSTWALAGCQSWLWPSHANEIRTKSSFLSLSLSIIPNGKGSIASSPSDKHWQNYILKPWTAILYQPPVSVTSQNNMYVPVKPKKWLKNQSKLRKPWNRIF